MKKTKLDLYRSAHSAAEDSLELKTDHAVQKHALSKFDLADGAERDWPYWSGTFNNLRETFLGLREIPADSTVDVTSAL